MSHSYRYNPDLPFVKENFPGNKLVKGRFVNEDGSGPIGFGKVLKWMFTANPQRAEKKADTFRLQRLNDQRIFTSNEDAFAWLGHSAFLIKLNGKLLLTDPCLFSLPGTKRLVEFPYTIEQLSKADYVLFSHTHRDHFDSKSVKLLLQANPELKFLVPLQMAPLLKNLGAKHITEAGWYQEFPEVNGIRFVFLPAKHWNRRFMHDTNRELWGSFWIGTEKRSVYFAGDTAPGEHFEEIGKLFPEIDHVFMPIGAYKPNYIMQDAHISPEEAVDAFHALGANNFIPKHYATFDLSDEPIGEPIRLMRDFHASGKLRGSLLAPQVGETIFFE